MMSGLARDLMQVQEWFAALINIEVKIGEG